MSCLQPQLAITGCGACCLVVVMPQSPFLIPCLTYTCTSVRLALRPHLVRGDGGATRRGLFWSTTHRSPGSYDDWQSECVSTWRYSDDPFYRVVPPSPENHLGDDPAPSKVPHGLCPQWGIGERWGVQGVVEPLLVCMRIVDEYIESIKPDSHRKIVQDYRSKTGKDQEILSESG